MASTRNFRDDINGLRAWAVVAVILFHFRTPGFDGGFVGVDIFFVISGFLMTGIIIRELEKTEFDGKNSFSLISFYLSRGRRIIPALLVLCMAILAVGWFFLSNREYRRLGADSSSALGFLSNVKFWMEAGYFDAASHEKWLLHTWSLSVEWQFYMLLPVVLLLVWKLAPGRRPATTAIAAIFLGSLALSVLISQTNQNTAFYMLHTRAWEMLAGGMVFLMADGKPALTDRMRSTLYFVGFALVIASIAIFDRTTMWPGSNALLPVSGTAMVLLASRQRGLLSGHYVPQRIGDWSYSLYLWHWPFAVGLIFLSLEDNLGAIAVSLAATLALGWFSYRFVETPSRKFFAKFSTPAASAIFSMLVIGAALPGVGIYLKNGLPGRLPSDIEAVFNEADNKNPRAKECMGSEPMSPPGCTYGGDSLGVIVIGDSHAGSIVRAVEKSLPFSNLHVLDWTYSGCPTIQGIKLTNRPLYHCGDFITEAIRRQETVDPRVPMIVVNRLASSMHGRNETFDMTTHLPPVLYITNPYAVRSDKYLSELRTGFIETICKFTARRPVYIVLPLPELIENVPKAMGRALQIGDIKRVSISIDDYYRRNSYVIDTMKQAAETCGAVLLDPLPLLCRDGRCWGDVNGMPIYVDDDHLNLRGSEMLIPMFKSVFREPLIYSGSEKY